MKNQLIIRKILFLTCILLLHSGLFVKSMAPIVRNRLMKDFRSIIAKQKIKQQDANNLNSIIDKFKKAKYKKIAIDLNNQLHKRLLEDQKRINKELKKKTKNLQNIVNKMDASAPNKQELKTTGNSLLKTIDEDDELNIISSSISTIGLDKDLEEDCEDLRTALLNAAAAIGGNDLRDSLRGKFDDKEILEEVNQHIMSMNEEIDQFIVNKFELKIKEKYTDKNKALAVINTVKNRETVLEKLQTALHYLTEEEEEEPFLQLSPSSEESPSSSDFSE